MTKKTALQKLLKLQKQLKNGFTLIELMVVMSIVALLMTMVGPLAINSVEKANAKQEMLSLKNWFRKVSARAFYTSQAHTVKLAGKEVYLYVEEQEQAIEKFSFQSLFFQPQVLNYSNKGFVELDKITGTYRGKLLVLELEIWINGEEPKIEIE